MVAGGLVDRTHDEPESPAAQPADGDPPNADRVQCPNCCRLASVTSRRMGLLFYRCELCETIGAVPDPADAPDRPA
jgi:hypothetical protein